jgi:anti-sigma-K factor RskA
MPGDRTIDSLRRAQAQRTPLALLVVVVRAAPEGTNALVASVSADGRSLVVRPLVTLDVDATRALELWAVPGQGAPRSLGLIQLDRTTVLQREQVLNGTAALAVSLEPPGGSPTGAPTGPILYTGAVSL